MSTMMTDDQGSANGAHGGVGHLLRMAKTQCGGSLAFAALRKADGGFAIATFPTLTADPTWTVESIDELVRQTWEDPHLTGGTVLVRSGRVLRSMWTGQGHHIKLAVAPLSDTDAPEHPWGLLCVAEPPAGHFEQDQLNLLANLATRLTSYLRARQRVLEGSLSFDPRPSAEPEPAPVEPTESAWTLSPSEPLVEGWATADVPPSQPDVDLEAFFEQVDDEHPLDQAADALDDGIAWGQPVQGASRVDDWEFLGLDQIEWVEAVTPATVPQPEVVMPAPEPAVAPPTDMDTEAGPPAEETWSTEARTEPSVAEPSVAEPSVAEPQPSTIASGASGLDALLAPDPDTGLASLTTLVGRLSSSLTHVANNEGTVGLILIEVSPTDPVHELGPSALMTVSGRLTNHLRDRDLVARIGPNLFAIMADLRPGSIELEVIRTRTVDALTAGVDSSTGGLRARSAMATAEAGSTETAESLLRRAADELPGQ